MTATQSRTDMTARGLRPAAQLAANRPHGDRVRYLAGCRCAECRAANTAYARQRERAIRAGDWNGLVSADRARAHMLKLASQGIGRRAVQAATDIADSILFKIRAGTRTQIRASTERAILAVTPEMASDHALVDARPAWVLIDALLRAGYTKARLARELGQSGPGLQLGRSRVTVRNAHLVERLHARLIDSDEALVDAAPTWRLINALRTEWYSDKRIARELGMKDDVLRLGRKRVTRAQARQVLELHRRLTS
jgi:hypothetical protein